MTRTPVAGSLAIIEEENGAGPQKEGECKQPEPRLCRLGSQRDASREIGAFAAEETASPWATTAKRTRVSATGLLSPAEISCFGVTWLVLLVATAALSDESQSRRCCLQPPYRMKEDSVREEEFQKRMEKKQAFIKNPRYSKSTEQAQNRSGEQRRKIAAEG